MPKGWKPGRHSWELVTVTHGPRGGILKHYKCRLCGMDGTNHMWSRGRVGHCYAQRSIDFRHPDHIYYNTSRRPQEPVEWTTDDQGHVVWL